MEFRAKSPRIAVFAHSHPFFSKGGGEIVAYNSFKDFYSRDEGTHLYCGINGNIRPSSKIFHEGENLLEYTTGELIFSANEFDNFTHTHRDISFFDEIVTSLIHNRIEVVHFHHFWNIGVDFIDYVMKRLPNILYVITLHEMLAICFRDGQMLKNKVNTLCYKSGDIDCHLCFPHIGRDDFRGRHDFFRNFLRKFDLVIAPSEFLAQRFSDWGIDKDIYVLENGFFQDFVPNDELEHSTNITSRFAFFGQPTPFKGIEIFVSAAIKCLLAGKRNMSFSLYGCDKASFLERFGAQWSSSLDAAGSHIQFHGIYEPSQVITLMRRNGYIVIPSIWWENSPLVIQEAYLAARPPIVANIGGMAEKVNDGVSGLHFSARDSVSLSDVMMRAADDLELWKKLRDNRILPPTVTEMNDSLIELYEDAFLKKMPILEDFKL